MGFSAVGSLFSDSLLGVCPRIEAVDFIRRMTQAYPPHGKRYGMSTYRRNRILIAVIRFATYLELLTCH